MKNEQNIFPSADPAKNALKFETTAQIVGVNRGPEQYKQVSYNIIRSDHSLSLSIHLFKKTNAIR